MKDTYQITNVQPPIDQKDVVNKEYYDNNFLSSNNQIDISNSNITELRKGYNQLKLDIDNKKFNQNITTKQLDDMFTTGLKEFKGVNKKTNSFTDEALLENKKTMVQNLIAILLESRLLDNKEQAILERHCDFDQEDIMKDIESYLLLKMSQPSAPSERFLYPNLSTVNEQYINDKILANNNFNNNINIIKDIRNYYETETSYYNKKLTRYKN